MLLNVQADAAREALLRGPTPFPQERLLSYFWNLLRAEGEADDEQAGSHSEAASFQQQSAEVFMLLRSLVSLRLLTQVCLPAHPHLGLKLFQASRSVQGSMLLCPLMPLTLLTQAPVTAVPKARAVDARMLQHVVLCCG